MLLKRFFCSRCTTLIIIVLGFACLERGSAECIHQSCFSCILDENSFRLLFPIMAEKRTIHIKSAEVIDRSSQMESSKHVTLFVNGLSEHIDLICDNDHELENFMLVGQYQIQETNGLKENIDKDAVILFCSTSRERAINSNSGDQEGRCYKSHDLLVWLKPTLSEGAINRNKRQDSSSQDIVDEYSICKKTRSVVCLGLGLRNDDECVAHTNCTVLVTMEVKQGDVSFQIIGSLETWQYKSLLISFDERPGGDLSFDCYATDAGTFFETSWVDRRRRLVNTLRPEVTGIRTQSGPGYWKCAWKVREQFQSSIFSRGSTHPLFTLRMPYNFYLVTRGRFIQQNTKNYQNEAFRAYNTSLPFSPLDTTNYVSLVFWIVNGVLIAIVTVAFLFFCVLLYKNENEIDSIVRAATADRFRSDRRRPSRTSVSSRNEMNPSS